MRRLGGRYGESAESYGSNRSANANKVTMNVARQFALLREPFSARWVRSNSLGNGRRLSPLGEYLQRDPYGLGRGSAVTAAS